MDVTVITAFKAPMAISGFFKSMFLCDGKMNQISGYDFKYLRKQFDDQIRTGEYQQAINTISIMENLCDTRYYKVIIEYYINFDNSLKLFDELFLSNNFNKYSSEGYFFSMKIPTINKLQLYSGLEYPWTSLNPSIIKDDQGFVVNIRSSNYRIFSGGTYISLESDRVIRTRNIIKRLDHQMNEIESYEIIQPKQYIRSDWGIQGFEDIRLFKWDDELRFLSATYDTHKLNVQRVIMGSIINKEIKYVINLNIPGIEKHTEKNWLPYIDDEKIKVIYSCHPFTILDITNPNKIKVIYSKFKKDYNLRGLRGSCSPISFNDGHLFMVHQVYTMKSNSKVYIQRLIYFDSENEIAKISHQFYFEKHKIEFCCGMCEDDKGNIVFTFGSDDVSAHLYVVSRHIIEEMLHDI